MRAARRARLRSSRTRAVSGLAAALTGAMALASGALAQGATAEPSPPPAPKPPPAQPPPQLTQADVDGAVARLDGVVQSMMKRTGVPGAAVGVVYKDRVVHLKGFGKRHIGRPGDVGADTVFQLASLSKPVSSTVVAGTVETGEDAAADASTVTWDEPVTPHLPGFALKDPWVSRHVTVSDLLSHRSGLPDHAGDLLEDLGYDQAYILGHLRLEPLAPFRASYAYTNFGFTAAAEAVARTKGVSWQKLSEDTLFKPAGMDSTSTTFADYEKQADKAVTHVRTADGTWQAKYVRDADAQSPAGGVSSSVTDMTRWLRLQLGNGRLDGRQIIDAGNLEHTHVPQIVSQPPTAPAARTGFYGLGWNVGYDDRGRLRLSHSGAFDLGANTNVTMLPGEQLGIVVLTNGRPVGMADAVALDFFDIAQYGKPTTDWLPVVAALYAQEADAGRSPVDYADPPADAKPARADSAYTGTYHSAYYGKAVVTTDRNGLVLELGPGPVRFRLDPYDGDTFSYVTSGENQVGRTGVGFTVGADGRATSLRVDYLDGDGLGTFTRG